MGMQVIFDPGELAHQISGLGDLEASFEKYCERKHYSGIEQECVNLGRYGKKEGQAAEAIR
jgi:hypothetical protein